MIDQHYILIQLKHVKLAKVLNMKKTIPIQISLTPNTHSKVVHLAKNVDCVSATGNLKAASVVAKTLRLILNFYGDEQFQTCLENEGMDTLAYIQRCIKKGMKESLKENK